MTTTAHPPVHRHHRPGMIDGTIMLIVAAVAAALLVYVAATLLVTGDEAKSNQPTSAQVTQDLNVQLNTQMEGYIDSLEDRAGASTPAAASESAPAAVSPANTDVPKATADSRADAVMRRQESLDLQYQQYLASTAAATAPAADSAQTDLYAVERCQQLPADTGRSLCLLAAK